MKIENYLSSVDDEKNENCIELNTAKILYRTGDSALQKIALQYYSYDQLVDSYNIIREFLQREDSLINPMELESIINESYVCGNRLFSSKNEMISKHNVFEKCFHANTPGAEETAKWMTKIYRDNILPDIDEENGAVYPTYYNNSIFSSVAGDYEDDYEDLRHLPLSEKYVNAILNATDNKDALNEYEKELKHPYNSPITDFKDKIDEFVMLYVYEESQNYYFICCPKDCSAKDKELLHLLMQNMINYINKYGNKYLKNGGCIYA